MGLSVGDKRRWSGGRFGFSVFEIKAMYLTQAIIEDNKTVLPCAVFDILSFSIPYQEPKPVRKLEAWEYKETGELSFYVDRKVNYADYRKLSDEELKDLIKGVIGEQGR